jgi:hypothetical protein
VGAIAAEAGASRLTVRRTLVVLDLAEAVEDGDLDDLYTDGVVAIVVEAEDGAV